MSKTPLGIRPPRRVNFLGSLKKSMISPSSSLASSMPATSSNVTLADCSESSRARLLELAGSFDDPEAEMWIVFDGPRAAPATSETAGLRVVFAPSADEWLLRRLRSAPDPSRLGVVTGDRRLAIRSRRRGARVIGPREFLERCRGSEADSSGELS